MYLFKKKNDLGKHLSEARNNGKSIGFVPTMGALHPGHLSLVNAARQQCDLVVCSIFVNPTQFNDPADFEKYPVTIEKDILLLTGEGTDVLFLPAVNEMYPDGTAGGRHYDFGQLETVLEGAHRPGHFQGVGIIVHKLLDIVQPDKLFMGQKDLQQCLIIKRLLHLIDSKVELIICPTLRETDGLAMSSRNVRLNPHDRQEATALFKALSYVKAHQHEGALKEITAKAAVQLQTNGFEVDYLDVIGLEENGTILFPERANGHGPLYAVVAAKATGSQVRLIDNLQL